MSEDKVLHVFGWDIKFVVPFREFVHEHFRADQHKFIIFGDVESGALPPATDISVYRRIPGNFIALSKAMNRAKKVIFHGLFNNHLFYALSLQPWVLQKSSWVIWGGDLYIHKSAPKDWRWKKNEFFRRLVLKRLGSFLTYVPGDYELAKKWYGAAGECHECLMYPSNVYKDLAVSRVQSSTVNIQVGNSADPSNNHIEVFARLAPFRDQDIAVYAPLSYGDKRNADAVMTAGKEVFGDKFFPMVDFAPFEEYRKFLGNVDIAIFNHKRQQGMGNIITLLGLGKKVYMRNDVTSRTLFDGIGVKVFDSSDIDLHPLHDDVRKANAEIIKDYFSVDRLRKQLKNIFED